MNKLVVILGPTASGKTKLAVDLALSINGEIISADSRQVYRQMNIGTGKDLNEYIVDGNVTPHHLIDIAEPGEKYNVQRFYQDFFKAYDEIIQRGNTPILCGGTGLYISSVLSGFEYASVPVNNDLRETLLELDIDHLKRILKSYNHPGKVDLNSKKRIIRGIEIAEYLKSNNKVRQIRLVDNYVIFGIDVDRDTRRERISKRLIQRLEEGMIEEVDTLLTKGISPEDLKYYGLEYKYITEYLEGKWNFTTMYDRLEVAIHQFAKRQMTYFRKMEKDSLKINWIKTDGNIIPKILKMLE